MSIDQFIEEHKEFIESINNVFLDFQPEVELEASWNYCIWRGCETIPFDQIEDIYEIKLKDVAESLL